MQMELGGGYNVEEHTIHSERDLEGLVGERVGNVFLGECTYAGRHLIRGNKYHGFIGRGNTPNAITVAYIKVGNIKSREGKVDAIDGKDMWLTPYKEEDCPITYALLEGEITFI